MAVIWQDGFSAAWSATNYSDEVGGKWSTSGGVATSVGPGGTLEPMYTKVAAHPAIADCEVSYKRMSAACDSGPFVRVSFSTSSTGYYPDIVAGSGTVTMYRRVNGVDVSLGTWSTSDAINDIYKLKVTGTGATVTLTFYKNGVAIGSPITDSSTVSPVRITAAGQCGIFSWDALSADDFTVDDLIAAPPTFRPLNYSRFPKPRLIRSAI